MLPGTVRTGPGRPGFVDGSAIAAHWPDPSTLGPGFQPEWTVGHILFEEPCDTTGQVVLTNRIVLAQIIVQTIMSSQKIRIAQDLIDPPGQHLWGEWRFGLYRNDLADLTPDPLGKIGERDIGANPPVLGQCPFKVPRHCGAGNDHLLCGEWIGGFQGKLLQQRLAQGFEAIGEMQMKHVRWSWARVREFPLKLSGSWLPLEDHDPTRGAERRAQCRMLGKGGVHLNPLQAQ